jgi:hypothetical protein
MVRTKHAVWICSLAIVALISTYAIATECVKDYTWKCADKAGNSCEGTFTGVLGAGNTVSFIESSACPSGSPPHKLWQVLRFGGLPKGTHKVRTSYADEDNCIGDSFGEILKIEAKQQANCDETGLFQVIQSLDSTCCSAEADYALNMSGTTDICIGLESNRESDGTSPGQDKFFTSHADGHSHPAIVTTLDTDYFGDSEQTNSGSIFSGNRTNTFVSDDSREVLQEGGTNHRLFHVYEILAIPSASTQTLKVEGYRPSNSDGDDFQILFKWSGTACTTTGIYQSCGVSINSGSESTYSCNVGNSSGRLCVAIDDTAAGSNNDKVYIDKMWVEETSPVCP